MVVVVVVVVEFKEIERVGGEGEGVEEEVGV